MKSNLHSVCVHACMCACVRVVCELAFSSFSQTSSPFTHTHTQLAATVDLFPTFANLVGAKLPNVTLDGFDMAPILFQNKKVLTPPLQLLILVLYPDWYVAWV